MTAVAGTTYREHEDVRGTLNMLRLGFMLDGDNAILRSEKGAPMRHPKHDVDISIYTIVRNHLLSRGEFFRCNGDAYYLDRVANKKINMNGPTPELHWMMRQLGLLAKQPITTLVVENLLNAAAMSPERDLHRVSFTPTDYSATYLNAGACNMHKVMISDVIDCPMGTDDVVLLANDIAPHPHLDALKVEMERIRPIIGRACLRPVAEAPAAILTGRWSATSIVTPAQAHWFYLGRYLFQMFASRYSLWPISLKVGEQESGKSTLSELLLALRKGKPTDPLVLNPKKEDAIVTALSNRSMVCYDNIDGVENDLLSNIFGTVATGGDIDLRKYFTTNDRMTISIRNHLECTARVSPFNRSDVARRVIKLEIAAPEEKAEDQPTKDDLVGAVVTNRTAILAEQLVRAQNILAAHQQHGSDKFRYVSQMAEYERFTYICASYEGTMDFAVTAWTAYMKAYREDIETDNALVHAIRLWLGSDPQMNNGRQISSTTLFAEIATIYAKVEQKFTYSIASAFGHAIAKQRTPLRSLGHASQHTRDGNVHSFSVAPEILADYHLRYFEQLEAFSRGRRSNPFGREQDARDEVIRLRCALEPMNACDQDQLLAAIQ